MSLRPTREQLIRFEERQKANRRVVEALKSAAESRMSYHYVECHVIVADDPGGQSLTYARDSGWWGSRLGEDSSGEEKSGDLILTTRRGSPAEAVSSIRAIADELRSRGFNVTRGKTEVVTFDTKLGDSLEE